MQCNVGEKDRTLRLVAGGVALSFALFGRLGPACKLIALAVGASALTTGLTRYCPLNQALGLDSSAGDFADDAAKVLDEARELAA